MILIKNEKHNCLRNRLDITDQTKLDDIESTLSYFRMIELDNAPIDKQFNLENLQNIHKQLFQDTYDWAGQLRMVNIHKGETNFLPHTLIEQASQHLFTKLAKENNLQNLNTNNFSERAGYYLGEINHIHPFREGNGRTQRAFINQLARHNYFYITWEQVTAKQMIEASIAAETDDHHLLSQIIKLNIVDKDYLKATRAYTEQANINIKHAQTGGEYSGKILGVTERYVVQQLADNTDQIIVHNRRYLARDVDNISHELKIRYLHGKIGLVTDVIKSDVNKTKDKSVNENTYNNYER